MKQYPVVRAELSDICVAEERVCALLSPGDKSAGLGRRSPLKGLRTRSRRSDDACGSQQRCADVRWYREIHCDTVCRAPEPLSPFSGLRRLSPADLSPGDGRAPTRSSATRTCPTARPAPPGYFFKRHHRTEPAPFLFPEPRRSCVGVHNDVCGVRKVARDAAEWPIEEATVRIEAKLEELGLVLPEPGAVEKLIGPFCDSIVFPLVLFLAKIISWLR